MKTNSQSNGALVISLDFELFWGVRDFLNANGAYWNNIAGERKAVIAILRLFEKFDIAATWASVGFLFSESIEEWESNRPRILPEYSDPTLSPYFDKLETLGRDTSFYFAPDLLELLKSSPNQEIGTHTYSHYYCLESGQTRESFEADIERAVETAHRRSIKIESIVFPRNQHNPDYDDVLIKHGILCYRGNQHARMYQFDTPTLNNPYYRATRLLDTFANVSGHNTFKWTDIWQGEIANVPASMFLRPVKTEKSFLSKLQLRRILNGIDYAAKNGEVFHLWWHPHNFGTHLEENLQFLNTVFERVVRLRSKYGFESLSMIGAAKHSAAAAKV
jgi:peptidoglycan/xylan/chitin deacetylase (PgdA/CDA1 family)